MWKMPKWFIYILLSSHHISCFSSLCLSVQDYGHVCVAQLQCDCVNPLWKTTFSAHEGSGGGGTPRRASLCGPVSHSEWASICRLPTTMHSRLGWQSEAHWPVTEIKWRAISVTKTTCSIGGTMKSSRGEGEGNGKGTQGDVLILTVTCCFSKWCPLSIPGFVVHLHWWREEVVREM